MTQRKRIIKIASGRPEERDCIGMATRTYKNGIKGSRYKGLYITGERGNYSVLDEEASALKEGLKSKADCEWEIEKMKADEDLLSRMRALYDMSIPDISEKAMWYFAEERKRKLTTEEKAEYDILLKIRARKSDNKEF